MRICVYGAASAEIDKRYIEEGERLGREIADRGFGLVFGAGANGMMGAAARGATEGGGEVIGIAPLFFQVDGVLYDKCTQLLRPETMRERKRLLEDMSDGFIITPGGIGTMDELFEILTLKQLGRHNKPIVILNTAGFYDEMLAMLDGFIKNKTLYPTVRSLYYVTDDANDCVDYIMNYEGGHIDPKKYKNI